MKACEEYLISMMQVLDGEASPEEETALHAHLAECTACRALYESYRAIDIGIKTTEEEPPEQLTAAVMNCIRRERTQNHPKTLLKRFRFTAIAAAAAVIVLVAAKIGDRNSMKFSGIQSFGTTAGTEAADAAAAPAEAPEMAAEFHEGGGLYDESFEKIETDTAAPQKAAPVPAPAAEAEPAIMAEVEEPEAAEENAMPTDDGDTEFSECIEQLQNTGYSGTVLYMKDVSSEELAQTFPNMTTLTLDGGFVLYEIQETDLETALTQFSVVDDYSLGTDVPLRYFIYLKG